MKRIFQILMLLQLGSWTLKLSAAPLHPAQPYPPDLATNVPANADLTWTPGDSELIRNGGFETGNATGWVRFNDGLGDLNNTYITNGSYIPVNFIQFGEPSYPPYAGNFCAITDQNGPGLISMYQDVLVPASAASVSLSWVDRIRNYFNDFVADPPQARQQYRVEIRTTNNAVLAIAYVTLEGDPVRTDWTKRSFDLTPYKGQAVRIAFVQEQWRAFFHLYYDNVSVRARRMSSVSYDVFFGTNAVPGSNDFQGTVSNGSWALPQLRPQQTYFWRVNARFGSDVFTGPVWRFTTAPVGPLDHFSWQPIASPQSPGTPFPVTLSARDAAENLLTNFNGTVTLSARNVTGTSTNNLIGNLAPSVFATFENATVGYSFTPNVDLLVVGFRHYNGSKVCLWTDGGILLGSQLAQGAPIAPIQLFAGQTYRLGVYSPNTSTNYLSFEGPATFAHGTLNQAYEGPGDALPSQPHPARWWLVDLIYSVPSLGGPAFPPSDISVSNGAWGSPVLIPNPGLIQLRADSQGHSGIANLFTVANNFKLEIVRSADGELSLRFPTTAGSQYLLESSATLAPNDWAPFGPTIPGTGGLIEEQVSPTNAQTFFRLRVLP